MAGYGLVPNERIAGFAQMLARGETVYPQVARKPKPG